MQAKREQAFVGFFVLIAAALLIVTIFALTGAFAESDRKFHAKFAYAAGLERGASVHYSGGGKIGRVESLEIDKVDPTLIDMTFSVKKDIPVKTDSLVYIASFSPLGDNHLEIKAGSPGAPLARPGTVLPTKPYVGFNELSEQLSKLTAPAQELLTNLNLRVKELTVTIARINDLLNDRNRANISASIADLHGMLAEDRPIVKTTLQNVNGLTQKFEPVLQQLKKTLEQADQTLNHVDAMVGENREDIHASVQKLRQSLTTIASLTQRLDQTLDVNSENIDEILDNLRHVTENLKEFSDTIKSRPSMLINSRGPREHKPGEKP
jgi:phospholipid/cholesterol/gamma-HCH transport system substrate-binding protein